MIRGGFLSDAERQALTAMARDGLAEHRVARRANAIVLLDKGWSCARVAGALLLDDDTVREWFQAYETGGLDALSHFGHEGSSCRLTLEQQAALQNWITGRLPRSTRTIGAWLEKNLGFNYSRPGLIALLHRLGFDYRKPHKMPRGLNDVRQLHRKLREASQHHGCGRGCGVRRCRPSHASGTGRGMLGAEGYCDRGRTDDRAPKPEHSWCHQP